MLPKPMHRIDAYRMIRRRAADAGFRQEAAGGPLENAAMAADARESPFRTLLSDFIH
jgi:hypothetical protein